MRHRTQTHFMKNLPLSLLLSILAVSAASAADKNYRIMVAAEDWDRKDTVVSFVLPSLQIGASVSALRSEGKTVPLQFDGQGHAWFVLPSLKKGSSKTYD